MDTTTHALRAGLALLLLGNAPLAGQQPAPRADTLRLAEAIAMARSANPMLAAARLRADAAQERIVQAGALPDPQLTFGVMNRPVGSFNAEEPMTMNQLGVSQMLPWPGKRGLARDQARHLASAESFAASEAAAMLVGRVKERYFEVAAIDRVLTIMETTRDLLRNFFEVAKTLYAVGKTPQQDLLRAQVAIAQMSEEITSVAQERVATAASLNALRGLAATMPVGAVALSRIAGELSPVDSLVAIATRDRPALLAAQERVRGAGAAVQAAKREFYPDLMVSLAYGQRQQFDDMATLMVGVTLPLRPGSRQAPQQREMEAMAASEALMADQLYLETVAELTAARADAMRAVQLATLYTSAILPQARAAVESALSAYRVGEVDYMTLVESQMTVNRYEIALVRITAQFHQATARIDALLGVGGEQ